MRAALISLLCAAVALLAAAEIACRLHPATDPRLAVLDHHAFRNQPGAEFDPLLGFRLQKNLKDQLLRQNAQGTIGEDFVSPKPAGTYRIVCLGGSTTMGVGVRADRDAYPARLERLLNAVTGGAGMRFEVINGGVYGYTSLHSALRATGGLDALDADLYLVMDGLNDLDAAQALSLSQLQRLRPCIPLAATEGSLAAGAVESLWRSLAVSSVPARLAEAVHRFSGAEETGKGTQDLPRKIEAFGYRNNLARLLVHARARGVSVVLVDEPLRIPLPVEPGARPPSGINSDLARVLLSGAQTIHDDNRALAGRFHVPLVETAPAFGPLLGTPDEQRFWADDLHLSREGYALLAQRVCETLLGLPDVLRASGQSAVPPQAVLERAAAAALP